MTDEKKLQIPFGFSLPVMAFLLGFTGLVQPGKGPGQPAASSKSTVLLTAIQALRACAHTEHK